MNTPPRFGEPGWKCDGCVARRAKAKLVMRRAVGAICDDADEMLLKLLDAGCRGEIRISVSGWDGDGEYNIEELGDANDVNQKHRPPLPDANAILKAVESICDKACNFSDTGCSGWLCIDLARGIIHSSISYGEYVYAGTDRGEDTEDPDKWELTFDNDGDTRVLYRFDHVQAALGIPVVPENEHKCDQRSSR